MNIVDSELARKLGNRHLSPDPGEKLLAPQLGVLRRVRIHASQQVAETLHGQQTLWFATNLVARQFGVIHELHIDVPNVALNGNVALFGADQDLATTLCRTASLIAGEALITRMSDSEAPVDAEIDIGADSRDKRAPFQTCVLGKGWSVFAGNPEYAPLSTLDAGNPFGPYFAACLGAGEVFKWIRGLRSGMGQFIERLMLSLWDYRAYDQWEELPLGELTTPHTLPAAYLIGAGAVGQALVACLAAAKDFHGYLTIIDHETIDGGSNINRYVLATLNDRGVAKSDLAARFLRERGWGVYPYNRNWPEYVFSPTRVYQRPDLAHLEQVYRYKLVLSCVDKNPARHAIQNFWPEYIIGGSTLGLGLAVAAYDMGSPYECLKCYNPLPQTSETIQELTKRFSKLSSEARRELAKRYGADVRAIEQYMNSPQCGSLGEQELGKFSDMHTGPDWSVGFVSAAAGVILACQYVKHSIVGTASFPEEMGNTLRFSFLNPYPAWSKHRRKVDCTCQGEGRVLYQSLWGRL